MGRLRYSFYTWQMSCGDYRSKSGKSQVCLRKGGLNYRNASLGLILIRPNIAETTGGLQKTHYFPRILV